MIAHIEATKQTVYFSPTARRHFLTKSAAARAEARAMIRRKYPAEHEERDDMGRTTYRGWHWTEDERLLRVYDRLSRMIKRGAAEIKAGG